MTAGRSGQRDDRVLLVTRALALVIVPILTVAFVMLWAFPDASGQLFAWPIAPPPTAMMLGATYLGGAWFFGRVLTTRHFHLVTLGFIPVSLFAGILGLATMLHLDRFTAGHPSFLLWTVLYASLPVVIPIVWWWNARHDPGRGAADALVEQRVAVVVGATGGLQLVAAAILVIMPDVLGSAWPWSLSPLTARVVGAMFALSGAVAVAIALDRRRAAARAIVEAQAIAIVGILIGLVRSGGLVDPTNPGTWVFVGGLLAVLGLDIWAATGRARRTPDAST